MQNKIFRIPNKNVTSKSIDYTASGDFNIYYDNVMKVYKKIVKEYPLLKLLFYPTNKPTLIEIRGWLVDSNLYFEIGNIDNWSDFNIIYIQATFDPNFINSGIEVYDYYKMIDVKKIEDKYCHMYDDNKICTHFPPHLKLYEEDKALHIIRSAESIAKEYIRYQDTGEFLLDCFPHGRGDALKKLKGIIDERRKI